jgi:hypothetical protein
MGFGGSCAHCARLLVFVAVTVSSDDQKHQLARQGHWQQWSVHKQEGTAGGQDRWASSAFKTWHSFGMELARCFPAQLLFSAAAVSLCVSLWVQ